MNNNLKKYKNIHKGKRVFLIGNGPSLSQTDLDLIKDEYSIAMNRISLIYEKTKWRPSYYIFISTNHKDDKWGGEWTKSILKSINENNTTPFIWEKFQKHFDKKKKIKKIVWIKNITETKPNINGDLDLSWWPDNIEKRIDKSGSCMNAAIQLAYYMGFSEIIFLGSDLGYTAHTHSSKEGTDKNHFVSSYNSNISPEKVNKINNQMYNVHKLARMKIPKEVKMYNASITTKLDIYPKICYETYIKDNKIKIIN